MASQALKKYKKLISEMPLLECSSTSKREIWEKNCKGIVGLLFDDGKEPKTISRKDVFGYAKKAKNAARKRNGAMEEFIYATLVWGYPTGNRGHIKDIVSNENVKKLVEHLNKILPGIQRENWQDTYREIKDIRGLGLSAYTKLLYFLEVSIDKHRALILDNKLIEFFRRQVFRDFNELREIRRDNAMKKYIIYLKQMRKVGKELKLGTRGVEKLEVFLYAFGSNIKI